MKYIMGIETRRYATVTVEADTEEEAFDTASTIVVEEPEKADWNETAVDTCTVVGEIQDYSPEYDRAYEEKKEACLI